MEEDLKNIHYHIIIITLKLKKKFSGQYLKRSGLFINCGNFILRTFERFFSVEHFFFKLGIGNLIEINNILMCLNCSQFPSIQSSA